MQLIVNCKNSDLMDLIGDRYECELLDWTTEHPKVPGKYWVLLNGSVEMGDVFYASERTMLVDLTDEESPMNIDCFTHFLGPLPVPQKPEMECPACNGVGHKMEGWQPTCGQCGGSGRIKS